jgi:hypothetical protein
MYQSLLFSVGLYDSSHAVAYAALIQVFVSFNLVAILVTNPYQKQASLSAIDCDLPDNLIETLIVKFLSDRTKTYLSGLSLDKPFVQLLA